MTDTNTTIHVSDELLRAIRTAAGAARDGELVRDCNAALEGDTEARARVAIAACVVRDGELVQCSSG